MARKLYMMTPVLTRATPPTEQVFIGSKNKHINVTRFNYSSEWQAWRDSCVSTTSCISPHYGHHPAGSEPSYFQQSPARSARKMLRKVQLGGRGEFTVKFAISNNMLVFTPRSSDISIVNIWRTNQKLFAGQSLLISEPMRKKMKISNNSGV